MSEERAWGARRWQRKPHIRPQPDGALGHRKYGALCDDANLRQPCTAININAKETLRCTR